MTLTAKRHGENFNIRLRIRHTTLTLKHTHTVRENMGEKREKE